MSVSKFIDEINKAIPFAGGKIYGLAHSIIRKTGSEIELLPGVIGENGEIKYVGIDDIEPMIIYHKSFSISPVAQRQGTGNSNDVVNTYNNSMIVFNDRGKTKMMADEVVLFIQANFPDFITMRPYNTIAVRFVNVNLNDQAVFASEYQGADFKLPANKNLFQVNYTIESTFKKRCFDKCPC